MNLHPNIQLVALCTAIFVSLSVLVLDGSYIGVSYMLVNKMNEFVDQHDFNQPLSPYFTLVFEVDAWLLMIPAGISCIAAMAWLVVPRIRESKVTQVSLSSVMSIFWLVVTIWTLVKVQGFASTFFCDDTVRDLGCYNSQAFFYSGYGDMKNPKFTFESTSMSVDLCRSTCSDQYDFYASVTGSYCTCVMWFQTGYNLSSDTCSTPCQGNDNQICGGNGAESVWISKAVGDDSVSQCFIYSALTGLAIVAIVAWVCVTALVYLSSEPAKVPFFNYDRLKKINKPVTREGGTAHDKNWAQLAEE